ncbi:TP901 family phage tail tape measure protein [Streptomyces acidiscabies]|uniref:Uncharacterized protein n=1 Tax=Streptomyces acidiscabies TaxID=42234 RepID=A0AAP6EHH2_9ACTN|nr:TP901 family phage tail tape measure protein [Streptomyces acidiscabies]MBZ3909426.1 hypothetical protein [Streptomyces acidiscabies]MDX2962406.1 hypothetical protein [Streptomyces acidiscabies]MDX3792425.1 hypothetical protein [Streptomyces acidiscabies]
MANDINLPNLVSHLQVNLDGVSGAVADASTQGSSMGAALGRGVNRELDRLLRNLPQVEIDGNSDPLDRDLVRIHRELAQLDSQRIGVDISIDDAVRQMERLQAHMQRISDEHPRVEVRAATQQATAQLASLLAAARHVDDTDVEVDVHVNVDEDRVRGMDRLTGILGRLGGMAGSLGGVAASMGKVTAAVGAALPLLAGASAAVAEILPASGLAATGLLSVALAAGTVKLATQGMGDALSAALDPGKTKEFNEALKGLAPSAQEFARSVRDAGPALRDLQKGVQQEFFKGLADRLERTGKSVLPTLRTNLLSTAGALRGMAAGTLDAAKGLADSGTLGKALGSASKGLGNLSKVPGLLVTGLGQVAAAAGPAFERLTAGAGDAATRIGQRLGAAFESGGLQKAIDQAVSLLGTLADVGGNVGQILSNLFAAGPGGGAFLGILRDITGEIAKVTASVPVQNGLTALFQTMATLGATVAPLLGQALAGIAPVLTALGPPAQTLIRALSAGIQPIITALGPVLEQAAAAVGVLVDAASPLLPVIGRLAAALLPALTPLLVACQDVFQALAPVVDQVAKVLEGALAPILAQLPAIIDPLAQLLAGQLIFTLTNLGDLLVKLAPSFVQLGVAGGELLAALAPLLQAVAGLAALLMAQLAPAIGPILSGVGQLAALFATGLTVVIRTVVAPALQALTALLRGDVSGAMDGVKKAVSGMVSIAISLFVGLPMKLATALAPLAGRLMAAAGAAHDRMISTIRTKIGEAVILVASLPGRAASALGNLGGRLASAGASLISGFISGIKSKIADVQSTLSGLTSKLTDWKGPKQRDAKILTPAGRLLIEGFIRGIDGTTSKLRATLGSITKALPANVRSGYGKVLAKATAELQTQVTKRDGVLKQLAAAQKRLDDLVKARAKAAGDITSGILDEANITTGREDVNSVTAITVGLQQALKKSTEFQANIAALKKSGLRADLLQQIADAGVAGGAATAAALAKATPQQLAQINGLQAQLAKSATATGNTVGDALYGAGIRAAQGLVAGLKSQEKVIEAQMKRIAQGMLTTVKDVHRTKSPSQAFRDIGRMDGEGLRVGILASVARVRDAARSMAGAALDVGTRALASTPTAGQVAAVYGGGASGGDTTNNFYLSGGDATPDGILRALSWQGLVGGR